jgi:hypothetical protein
MSNAKVIGNIMPMLEEVLRISIDQHYIWVV